MDEHTEKSKRGERKDGHNRSEGRIKGAELLELLGISTPVDFDKIAKNEKAIGPNDRSRGVANSCGVREKPLSSSYSLRPSQVSLRGVMVDEEDIDDTYDEKEHGARSKSILSSIIQLNEVIPPENFSHVVGEIYRSSFPRPENFSFLKDRIKLKSILVLLPEEYPQENLEFMKNAGIKLFQIGMSGNKEPFVNIPSDSLTEALQIAINPENHPILIHCNRGKHRTGCLVGCIRKLQNWSLTMIFDEYRRFAFPKARAMDQQFIEMYNNDQLIYLAKEKHWLPIKW